ncbi:MAG: efflux RND transporter periplasmic adaptor subunit [Chloroflexia bacterium]|nr:efflux RND transporter periplasmic adaptor subunit [Chloroflexia bacterium]
MKKRTLIISVSVVVIIAAIASAKLISNAKEMDKNIYKPDTTSAVFVSMELLTSQKINTALTYEGSFEANKEIQIMPERGGKVTKSYVELGDYITKGSPIAHIDNDELLLQLEDAQTQYNDALRDYNRYKELAGSEAVSQNVFDKAELALKGTKNGLDIIKKQLSYMNINAPMNGYITYKNFEQGAVISPAMPIASITDISLVKLSTLVPENAIARFKLKQQLAVTCDAYPDKNYTGIVEYIAMKADEAKNFVVKIKVANETNEPIRAGMFGKARLSINVENALLINRDAVVGSTKQPQVYVVEDGKAKLKNVSLGNVYNDKIEVLSGLTTGNQVITSGIINLFDGAKVAQIVK